MAALPLPRAIRAGQGTGSFLGSFNSLHTQTVKYRLGCAWGEKLPHLLENFSRHHNLGIPKLIVRKKYHYLTTSGLRGLNFNASIFPPMHLVKNK